MAKRPKKLPAHAPNDWDALLPLADDIGSPEAKAPAAPDAAAKASLPAIADTTALLMPPEHGWTLREAWFALFPLYARDDPTQWGNYVDYWQRASATLLRSIVDERQDLTFAGVPTGYDKDLNAEPIVLRRNVFDADDRAQGMWTNISIYDGTFEHGPLGGKPPRVTLYAVRIVSAGGAAQAQTEPSSPAPSRLPAAAAAASVSSEGGAPQSNGSSAMDEAAAGDEKPEQAPLPAEDGKKNRRRGRKPTKFWDHFDMELIRLARMGVYDSYDDVREAMLTFAAQPKFKGTTPVPGNMAKRVSLLWDDGARGVTFWRDFDAEVVGFIRDNPKDPIARVQQHMRLWAARMIPSAEGPKAEFEFMTGYKPEIANARVQRLCARPRPPS